MLNVTTNSTVGSVESTENAKMLLFGNTTKGYSDLENERKILRNSDNEKKNKENIIHVQLLFFAFTQTTLTVILSRSGILQLILDSLDFTIRATEVIL